MSYQVIARKWRPQAFEEITGQEAITRTLRNAITANRLHHAYLFAGPRGVGKTTTARLLAKALNCQTGPTATPCGRCPSCLEITAGNSIDVLEIDAASHTGVDNIRDVIINTVANRPARDRYKVFIIDEIHMLSTSAFNALLKTLEEPPSHVVFIMATTELHKLPETILSRCQQFEFRTIGADKIAERLRHIANEEHIAVTRDALLQIAYAGRGSMRDAQSAFDQVIAFTGTDIQEQDVLASLGIIGPQFIERLVDGLAAHDGKQVLVMVDELVRTGYDLRQFVHEIMTYLRNLLVLKTAGDDAELLPVAESELRQLKSQAGYFSNEDLVRFFTLLTEVEQNIRFSHEPRFQLEFGLVKLTQLAQLKNLETILERLEKLAGNPNLSASNPSSGTASAPYGGTKNQPSGSRPAPSSAAPVRTPSPPPPRPIPPPSQPAPPKTADSGQRTADTALPSAVTERLPIAQTVKPDVGAALALPHRAQQAAPVQSPQSAVRSPQPEVEVDNSKRTTQNSKLSTEPPPWADDAGDVGAPPPEPPDEWDASPSPGRTSPSAKPGASSEAGSRAALSLVPGNAPAPSSVDLAAPDAMQKLLEGMKADLEAHNKMLLLAALEKVERAELEGNEVVLSFPVGATEFHKQVVQPTGAVVLQEAVRRLTGKQLKVRARLGKSPLRNSSPSESEVNRGMLFRQAESDSVVQSVLKTFRGELVDVKPPDSE